MDLYSTDGADISTGSMRHSQMEDIARATQARNDNLMSSLGSQLSDLAKQQTQQKEADYIAAAKNVVEGLVDVHGLHSAVKNLDTWSGARKQAQQTIQDNRTKLIQGGEGNAPEPILRNESSVTTPVNRPEGANAGSTNGDVELHNSITAGPEDDLKTEGKGTGSLVEEGVEGATSKVGKGLKIAGGLSGLVTGGVGLYQDFKDKNSNGWEKAGDVLSTLGGIADVGGVAFAPLEAVGAITGLVGTGLDEIGELFESKKEKQETAEKQKQKQEQQQQAQEAPIQATMATPQVALARTQ